MSVFYTKAQIDAQGVHMATKIREFVGNLPRPRPKFMGTFLSVGDIPAYDSIFFAPTAGSHVYVDGGVDQPTELYLWDEDTQEFVKSNINPEVVSNPPIEEAADISSFMVALEAGFNPGSDTGLAKDYPGTGWYKATDTGTVFNKDVPALETHVFSDSPKEYVSVYTKEDAALYGERAAVSNITDMSYLFAIDDTFNEDISSWDVSNVTDMSDMFSSANSFNQDISSWDVSNVTNMWGMFDARAFNQDLSQWCVSKIPTKPNLFDLSASSWSLPRPVWGTSPRSEDGSVPETPEEPNTLTGLRADYPGTGWYKATDTGTVFNKGIPALETMVFEDGGLEYVSVYAVDDAKTYGERAATSNITDMSRMFYDNASFNQDISNWDVSNVTDMSGMFENAGEKGGRR